MPQPTLVVAAAVSYVAACAYAVVATALRRERRGSDAAKRAMNAFILWWSAIAANVAIGATLYLAAAFGWTDFTIQVTYAYVQRLLVTLALTGLVTYLLYLFTGRDLTLPVAAANGALFVLMTYSIAAARPEGVFVGDWRTDVAYAGKTHPLVRVLITAGTVLPPLVAAIAYSRLYFHIRDPSRRYRVALVSIGLTVWWIVAVVAGQQEAMGRDAFQLLNRFLGPASALLILAAYRPPAWVTRRWGIAPVPDAPRGEPAAGGV